MSVKEFEQSSGIAITSISSTSNVLILTGDVPLASTWHLKQIKTLYPSGFISDADIAN